MMRENYTNDELRRKVALTLLPIIYQEYWDGYIRKDGGTVSPDWRIELALDAFDMAQAFIESETIFKERKEAIFNGDEK